VKFINDEELLALFPGRPLALVGKPGEQQLVFLDQLVAGRNGQDGKQSASGTADRLPF
jgi:hypothetical protein